MSKSDTNSTKSTPEKLLDEAQKLFGADLKTPASSINSDLLDGMVGAENQARAAAGGMSSSMHDLAEGAMAYFSNGLKDTKLNDKQKNNAKSLFASMVIKRMQEAAGPLSENFKEGKGVLFNAMLSQKTVDILQGILDFKKKIDEQFPGLSDAILSAAKIGIAMAMASTVQSAVVLIALDQTKIIDKSLDFFKTDNLEKTIDKLKEGLEEVNKDKKLAESMKDAEKISEITQESGIGTKVFAKLGIPSRFLDAVLDDLNTVPEVKNFMQDVAEFSQKIIPNNQEEIEATLKEITENIAEQLKQSGVAGDDLDKIIKEVSSEVQEVSSKWGQVLESDKQFFDKVIVQQECAIELMEVCGRLTSKLEGVVDDPKAIANAVSASASKVIKDKVQGAAEDLKNHLQNPKVAQFAKNNMGSKLRSSEAVKRAEKAVNLISGNSKSQDNARQR